MISRQLKSLTIKRRPFVDYRKFLMFKKNQFVIADTHTWRAEKDFPSIDVYRCPLKITNELVYLIY